MRELPDILAAFEALCAADRPAALATVVRVEGSAYRRPGARMLVAEDGRCWGCVSGGCLERDVVRRATGVIATGRPIVARYDTTDDEALAAGVATGCRGVVEVFIERVDGRAVGPLEWTARVIAERRSCAIATVMRGAVDVGARLVVNDDGGVEGELKESAIGRTVVEWVASTTAPFASRVLKVGGAEVFVELIAPAQAVVIFGGGPDVVPVVRMAKELGWHVTVVAARPATGLGERFALADRILVTSSAEPLAGVCVDPAAAVVLMTHNFPRDVRILAGLGREPRYLGILEPRARTRQLLDEVGGSIRHWDVRAPIGLDLGAESPEEIALAIVAEIQAVVRGAAAGFLRERAGPIHERAQAAVDGAAQRGGAMRDVAAVILAAGGSQRMGRTKQLLRVEGQSLVRRAAEAVVTAGCGPVVLVVGARAEEVEGELCGCVGVEIVRNEGWERGIGTSIRAGVAHVLTLPRQPLALMIMLCDQPLVGAAVLERLLAAHAGAGRAGVGAGAVTAAEFDGTLGPPVILDAALFSELLALPEDRGAKALWMERPEIVRRVACPEAGVDVDTPGDFERLLATARTQERHRAQDEQGK